MKLTHNEVLTEYYKHLQHTEKIRANFLNFFISLQGGGIIIIKYKKMDAMNDILLNGLLIVISIMGILIAKKQTMVISGYSKAIFEILDDYDTNVKYFIPDKISISYIYECMFAIFSLYYIINLIKLTTFGLDIIVLIIMIYFVILQIIICCVYNLKYKENS